jgi:flavin reductase (DIM6/NTAB) family NADH-FMN oxidoreductase RutF
VVNAAPFSMFNMVGEDPPILMLSINRLADGRLKDTAANILDNGEFVVHMSDEPWRKRCTLAASRLPADVSELTGGRPDARCPRAPSSRRAFRSPGRV